MLTDQEDSQLTAIAHALAFSEPRDWDFVLTTASNQPDLSDDFLDMLKYIRVALRVGNLRDAEKSLRRAAIFANHLDWALSENGK